jgi:DNA-binding transcriptional LysR family regulator
MHDSLDWDDVRFFLAAAQEAGFGAAARRLETQQSTVSRRVAALEKRLGGALFDRTAAGLTLTALGQRVLQQAKVMEEALTHVVDAASATEKVVEGVVRIAMTETVASVLVIPTVLPKLLAAHPGLKVDLVIGNTSADLARREADLALRFFLEKQGDLLTRRVARLETAVMATPVLAKKLVKTAPREWPFVSVWLEHGVAPEEAWREAYATREVRVTTNSFHAQLESVRAGLGVAVLPCVLGRGLGLVEVAVAGVPAPPAVEMFLVVPRALRRVPRVAAVFDALCEPALYG